MSEMFNEEFNDCEKSMKNICSFPLGKQACGFFGDNSKQITLVEHSPQKHYNNNKQTLFLTQNSNLYSLKTVDNTEANFKKENFKSSFPNEFKILSTASTKLTEKAFNRESNINFIGSNNEILYSGYFGQKYETKKINDDKFSKIASTLINPFADIIEEEADKITPENNKNALKPLDMNEPQDYTNNNTFMEDSDKNFNDFLNLRNIEYSRNKNTNAGFEGNGTCGASKPGANKDFNFNNDENENKKQFNNLVRSVTISSFNSFINNNNTENKSNLMSCSGTNIFDYFSLSQNSCSMAKKKKIQTSEEIVLEKIKKEKEELKKLKEINSINFEKSKLFISKPLPPTPLTIIKPFNLSANYSKMLMKKRMVSVNTNEINNKIAEHMRKKCESLGFKESLLNNNNRMILNKTPNQFKFVSRTERSNSKSPLKKMTFAYENSNDCFNYNNKSRSNNNYYSNLNNNFIGNCKSINGYCLNLEEENTINNLSSRIEKYCNVSQRYMNKNASNISNSKSHRSFTSSSNKKNSCAAQDQKVFQCKSPLKFYLEQNKENDFLSDNFINYTGDGSENNLNLNADFTVNALNISSNGATSIRKMFDFEGEKDPNKVLKAKPMKKDTYGKSNANLNKHINSSEVDSFNSILEKSRQDKFALDKLEKEKAKKAKINEIKTSKFGVNKASNAPGNFKKTAAVSGNNYLTKRSTNSINKNKIVDFNELMLTED